MHWGVDVGARRLALACPERNIAVALKVPISTPSLEVSILVGWLRGQVGIRDLLWIEAPIVGASGNAQTALRMAITVGAILGVHPGGHATLVAPASWKKVVVGHGHASKNDVKSWLDANHPALAQACHGDQDRYDATCLGLFPTHWLA